MKRLIGFYTNQRETTEADVHFFALKLAQYWNYKHYGMNDVARAMCGMLLIGMGYSQDEAAITMKQDEVIPPTGLTPVELERSMKQWGRWINEELWEIIAKPQIAQVGQNNNVVVLCHDRRDTNFVRDLGGWLIRVKKRGSGSQVDIHEFPLPDLTLRHNGEAQDKFTQLQKMMQRIDKMEESGE